MKTLLCVLLFALPLGGKEMTKPIGRCVSIKTDHGSATGVVIGQNLVLTCFHNLQTDSDIKVNGVIPKILKVSPKNDLALLEVKTPYVSPIEMAETIRQDEEVFIYGNPMGHLGTILRGRIVDLADGKVYVDAHVFFGSSGSGMYNSKGQLVGIITEMQGREGYGMPFGIAVPSFTIFKFLTGE
jgi:S1-C subfamily serine protease